MPNTRWRRGRAPPSIHVFVNDARDKLKKRNCRARLSFPLFATFPRCYAFRDELA